MSARITLLGRLGQDPELRFTPAGKAVTSFSLATSRRVKKGDEWEDTDTTWWQVSCWEQLAENTAEALRKGMAVIVEGSAVERSWEDRDGTKRSRIEVRADHVGVDLRWSSGSRRGQEQASADPWASPGTDDPWASPSTGQGAFDDPPF